jgi:drug/metabolite transporter (DMT)-like permease
MFDRMSAGVAFGLFAVGLALRDVLSELLFHEDWLCNVLVICGTIAFASTCIIALHGSWRTLLRKLRAPGVVWRVIVLALSAVAIYGVTFYMINKLKMAAMFDLVDYGFAPILTAIIGLTLFGESFQRNMVVAALLFIAGIILMKYVAEQPSLVLKWFLIALISPVVTAFSDALTKWLLTKGGLTREQLLFCRFAPATVILFVYIALGPEQRVHLNNPIGMFAFYLIFGLGPLYLLCTGLGKAALTKFAAYEAAIPALVYFGSLPWHPANRTPAMLLGAIIIILSMLIAEGSILRKIRFPSTET